VKRAVAHCVRCCLGKNVEFCGLSGRAEPLWKYHGSLLVGVPLGCKKKIVRLAAASFLYKLQDPCKGFEIGWIVNLPLLTAQDEPDCLSRLDVATVRFSNLTREANEKPTSSMH